MPLMKQPLFTAGEDGYALYRNPGIAVLGDGTVIAFTEARRPPDNPKLGSDWAASGIACRVSRDGGATFEEKRWMDKSEQGPTHNPTPVADTREPHTLHFLYGKNYSRVYYAVTRDSGRTWSQPRDITDAFEPFRGAYDWKVVATGIGHGAMLSSGRILVPAWLSLGTIGHGHRPSRVGAVYSDDGGETWLPGGLVPDTLKNPSETQAAELSDGRVLLNIRNEESARRRAFAYSCDGGLTFSAPLLHPTLWEPVCCASFVRVPQDGGCGRAALVFVNPDSQSEYETSGVSLPSGLYSRHHLSARLSQDDGATWPWKRVIEEGVSGYSDIAARSDGALLCTYNEGTTTGHPFDKKHVMLAVFFPQWIKEGDNA